MAIKDDVGLALSASPSDFRRQWCPRQLAAAADDCKGGAGAAFET
jgi:hypothetical protein